MNIELISSHEGIAAGDRVTYEIQGLEPREEGIYIVRWIIEPPGRLIPTGEDVGLAGANLLGLQRRGVGRTRPGNVRRSRTRTTGGRRDRRPLPQQPFSLREAPEAHSAVGGKSEAAHRLQAVPPRASGGGANAGGSAAAAGSAPVRARGCRCRCR